MNRATPGQLVDGYTLAFLVGAIVVLVGAVVLAVLMEHVFPEDHVEDTAIDAEPASAELPQAAPARDSSETDPDARGAVQNVTD